MHFTKMQMNEKISIEALYYTLLKVEQQFGIGLYYFRYIQFDMMISKTLYLNQEEDAD